MALLVVEDEAEFIRGLFRRYLELGSVVRLKDALDAEAAVTPARVSRSGRTSGGRPFSRGHLYGILSNPIYIGRLSHKGQVHEGLHAAIVEREVWETTRKRLHAQTVARREPQPDLHSFLAGKLYDDRGNRMGATYACKRSKRFRYYVSRPALVGDANLVGSLPRISAPEIEREVIDAVQRHLASRARPGDDRNRRHELRAPRPSRTPSRLSLSSPQSRGQQPIEDIDAKVAIFDARRWLDELIADPGQTIEAIATREHRSPRSLRMTLSLAFLSPQLVKAALEGRLPRGLNVRRLTEMPMLWSGQWRALGIQSPAAADA